MYDFLNKGKFLVCSEYYNQFDIYINLPVYPSQRQVNLSYPEAYLEPCQISKIEFLAKIVNG